MLDEKDAKILEELQRDSSQTTGRIAKKTGIPTTTVHNRIKKLQADGIITGYTVKLDYNRLGQGIEALIFVTVSYTDASGGKLTQEEIASGIKKLGAVSVEIITGGYDILCRVRASSVQELNEFVIDKLRTVSGVDKTHTMIVLNSV